MSGNRAQSQYLRLYVSGGSDLYLWQNFYVNQTVTLSSKSYRYFPFAWGGVAESSAPNEQTVSLSMPATTLAIEAFQEAFDSRILCELKAFEFDARLGVNAPQSGQTLIASFLGYASTMSGTFTDLQVELGASLAPIGSTVPNLIATNSLVGIPIQP
mgnify:FL=1|jgi:hypothetical protein